MQKILLLSAAMLLCPLKVLFAQMAFVAHLDNNWDLFVVDDNGKNPVQLTHTPFDERDPNWFPDGKKLVYSASDGRIYTIELETKKVKQLVDHASNRPQITPSVSPCGQKVAFACFCPTDKPDDTDLIIYDLVKAKRYRLLDQPAIQIWPAWSPDGKRIVYANVHCASSCGRIIQELWVADADGSWARQLLLTHGFCQQPVWSPDGNTIAFASDHNGDTDIWSVNLTDWKMTQQTRHSGLDSNPAWSPDGSKLAFVSMRSKIMTIWVKNLRNQNIKSLSPFGHRNIACKDVTWR